LCLPEGGILSSKFQTPWERFQDYVGQSERLSGAHFPRSACQEPRVFVFAAATDAAATCHAIMHSLRTQSYPISCLASTNMPSSSPSTSWMPARDTHIQVISFVNRIRKWTGKIIRVAVISAKIHKRQHRKRQSVTAKREKSQTRKVLTAILTLRNLT